MKLQTNYFEMTDEQLYRELLHRVSTFGDNLPTYVTGGEYIEVEGFKSKRDLGEKLKGVWLGDFLDRNKTDQAFTVIENPLEDEPYNMDDALEIIEIDHPRYRELLIKFLQTKFVHIEQDQEYDQQENLATCKCICCNDEDHNLVNYSYVLNNAEDVWELEGEE